ncbi:MAG: ABC transporter substrate-binding protein [Egibacteraceae bacterium]
MRVRRGLLPTLLLLALALLLGACEADGEDAADDADADAEADADTEEAADGGSITVGAFDFPESLVLATLYAEALEADGYDTEVQQAGQREALFPALENGDIDVLPEYNGNALDFVLGGEAEVMDSDATTEMLREEVADDGLVVLDAAEAENGDELAMTAERADELGVTAVGDLVGQEDDLTIAGSPEFAERSTGLVGLEEVYGLEFGDFLQTDACGPETFDALSSGAADVARLCSTDPPILEQGWVVLEEDEPFTLANNIVPVGREDALDEGAREVLNAVSAELTTEDLQDFNTRFGGDDPEDAEAIVTDWLAEAGLLDE